jgi:oxygen-independent coproporphyrinogen-3 oxidase
LYCHVPFCSSICNYCNFNRGLYDEPLKGQFVAAVLQEMAPEAISAPAAPEIAPGAISADTLYFGGGTPSLLAADDSAAIIDRARASLGLRADAEITLEANPETVDSARMEQFRRAGVNRLSFGVQSFRDEELQRLGRTHTAERARQAVSTARAAGFANISLDLMMWLPGQTLAHWLVSVQQAIDAGPEHLSLYILEVYPHLPLRQEIDRHGWTLPPDDAAADMYESAMERLERAGYGQYEISNVCRPGRESRHNLKYWTDGDWLGFGPGAHSTWKGTRWRSVSSTAEYVQKIDAGDSAIVDVRQLSNDERLGDALFTGLRLNRGVDIDAISKRYGVDVWRRFGERLAPYLEAGLLWRQDTRLRLTRRGMLLANEVMSAFV